MSQFQTEDTARLKNFRSTAQEQIRQLAQRTNDTIELLRTQRDALRQRGMNLPPNSMDTLKTLKSGVDKLNVSITNLLTELKQLRELVTTASIVNSSLDTGEVLNEVMDTVVRITGAERGYIALVNNRSGAMEYPVRRGIDKEQLEQGDLVVSSSIINEVLVTGQGVITENASKDNRFQGHQSVIGFQLRSILAVPLKVQDNVIGVVYCDNRIVDGLFKSSDLNLIKAFASQAAVAIENARLYEALQAQVAEMTESRDLLTNIFSSIVNGVITINRDDIVTDCNPAAEAVIGRSRDFLVGYRLVDNMLGVGDNFYDGLVRVREQGTPEHMVVEPLLDGVKRYWNITMSPLRDSDGITQGVAIVLDDQTEARRREEQLGIVSNYMKLKLENIQDAANLDVGGQEREISMLHSDVRGFTTFSEQLEPERLMEIINAYISLSSDAINLYEGVVDKYMGDAVTGLFNTQFNPQEDHALRAVRAAMSMKYDLLALHEVLPEEQRLFYGIGVHTGMAVLGNIGGAERKEYGALGDAPDLAKLLQENAERGEVLISEATYERVKDLYECEALEPRKTKGHDDFKLMYRVLKHKKRTGMLAQVNLDDLDF
ncbi:MAG: GAF domain-containing protein [Chloroflexi bacterium]|nr:GAF domain-containing protein [Chloroflexota bacterium]MCC6896242.1 GAF domain-containing protein [Anaerolineae bacterium]